MAGAHPAGPVRRRAAALALAAALAAAACAAPAPGGGGGPEAQPHAEKRFLVQYGERQYRVNVRYVDIISESVVAVREGRGDAAPPDWVETVVEPSLRPPEGEPFASEAWRAVAVDIADSLSGRPPICDNGQTMRLARNDDKGARALYRSARQAWVVFAFCPPAGTG